VALPLFKGSLIRRDKCIQPERQKFGPKLFFDTPMIWGEVCALALGAPARARFFPPAAARQRARDGQSNANRDRRANGRAWRDRADRVSWAVISTAIAYWNCSTIRRDIAATPGRAQVTGVYIHDLKNYPGRLRVTDTSQRALLVQTF